MRDCFKKLQYILKPSSHEGVSKVEIQCRDDSGNPIYQQTASGNIPTTELLYARSDLEPAILKCNQNHFNQA